MFVSNKKKNITAKITKDNTFPFQRIHANIITLRQWLDVAVQQRAKLLHILIIMS